MQHRSLFLVLILVFCQQLTVLAKDDGNIVMEGDLLFFGNDSENEITRVTNGFDNCHIDHVAIAHYKEDKVFVLEAVHKGVVMSPLESRIRGSESEETHSGVIYVGRLRDTTNVCNSVKTAMTYIGRPYDFYFEQGDSAIYCSELVQISYKDKNGAPIFIPQPMSFHDASGKITEYWKEYYKKVNKDVPEGEPGSNPGAISRSDKITIIGKLSTEGNMIIHL